MIKYDYTIKRNEGRGDVIFEPTELPKELPNYILIEGKNARGKSTLLHLLALAFHGASHDGIAAPLVKKMKNLLSGGKNHTIFNVEVFNDGGKLEITASKKSFTDNDIIVSDESGTLSPTEIKKKYNLIYDIPADPINRLMEMSNEVKDIQASVLNNSKNLVSEIRNTINDIRDARNPHKIAQLKEDMAHFEQKIASADSNIPLMLEEVRLFTRYSAVKYFKLYSDKLSEANAKLISLDRSGQARIKQGRKTTKELRDMQATIKESRTFIKAMHDEIYTFLESYWNKPQQKKVVNQWKKIDVDQELDEPQYSGSLKDYATQIKTKLQEDEGILEKDENIKKIEFLHRMIELLDQMDDVEYEIPGAKISVEKLKQALNKEIHQYDDKRIELNNVRDTARRLTDLLAKRIDLEKVLIPQYKKLEKDAEKYGQPVQSDDSSHEEEYKLKAEIAVYKKNVEYYRARLAFCEIDEENINDYYSSIVVKQTRQALASFTEKDFAHLIDNKNEELSKMRDNKKRDEFQRDSIKKDLVALESREPHPYQAHLDCLDKYGKLVATIVSRMTRYGLYLDPKGDKKNNDMEYLQYMEKLRSYLGKRMGKMRYATVEKGTTVIEEITVDKLDLEKELIYTTDKREISFMDISSGHTQALYLKQRLHSSDNRKIIALFDEVGMMDEETMVLVKDELKKLHAQGKLLLAVIAQKKDKLDKLQFTPLMEG